MLMLREIGVRLYCFMGSMKEEVERIITSFVEAGPRKFERPRLTVSGEVGRSWIRTNLVLVV